MNFLHFFPERSSKDGVELRELLAEHVAVENLFTHSPDPLNPVSPNDGLGHFLRDSLSGKIDHVLNSIKQVRLG